MQAHAHVANPKVCNPHAEKVVILGKKLCLAFIATLGAAALSRTAIRSFDRAGNGLAAASVLPE